jgi:hypothetical protein
MCPQRGRIALSKVCGMCGAPCREIGRQPITVNGVYEGMPLYRHPGVFGPINREFYDAKKSAGKKV